MSGTFRYDSLEPYKPPTAEALLETLREIAKPRMLQPTYMMDYEARTLLGIYEKRDHHGFSQHVLGFIAYGDFDAVWAWGTRRG